MLAKVVHLEGSTAGRILLVGDIHGCAEQLRQVLTKANFTNTAVRRNPDLLKHSPAALNDGAAAMVMEIPAALQRGSAPASSPADDHTSGRGAPQGGAPHPHAEDVCVFVGDLINKGPDSFGVVRTLHAIGAIGVTGNHDEAMLRLVEKLRDGTPLTPKEAESSLLPLAQSCPADVYAYMTSIPHILCLHAYRLIVVHAGIDPSIPLESQTAESATRMRNIISVKQYNAQPVEPETGLPAHVALSVSKHFATLERPKIGKSWSAKWSKLACKLNEGCGPVVLPTFVEANENESCKEKKDGEESDSSDDDEGEGEEEEGQGGKGGVAAGQKGQSSKGKKKEKWRKKVLPTYKGYTVVYGHDAKRRLNLHSHAYGLDSGCVYGGELTCLVWPSKLVSVPGLTDLPPGHKSKV